MDFVVDIDLTVVDAIGGDNGWIDWLVKQGFHIKPEYENYHSNPQMKLPYAIYEIFENTLRSAKAYEFWGLDDLYQKFDPIPGSVETINRLIEEGHSVTFCSFCVDDHWHSKHQFIKDHFHPNCDVVMVDNPKIKTRYRGDVYIDDRLEYLQNIPEGSKAILKSTRYTQNIQGNPIELSFWDYDHLNSLIGMKKLSAIEANDILKEACKLVKEYPGYRLGQAIWNLLPVELAMYDKFRNEQEHAFFYNTQSNIKATTHFFNNLVE